MPRQRDRNAERARSGESGTGQHRVVMVEDHDMVGAALRGVLHAHADMVVVDLVTTIADALDSVGRHRPDVLVTDLRLTDGVVTDHLAALADRSPETRTMIVTGSPSEKALLDSFDGGAIGFVDKARPIDEFVDAVRRVARGEVVVSPDLAPALLARLSGRSSPRGSLTARELEVLQQLADGRSTETIASSLCLSANTVRNHIARAMLKLRTHTRLEAVSEAARRGLIARY